MPVGVVLLLAACYGSATQHWGGPRYRPFGKSPGRSPGALLVVLQIVHCVVREPRVDLKHEIVEIANPLAVGLGASLAQQLGLREAMGYF